MLWVEREGTGPRVVLVHGFTQTRASWGPVAADLATDHEVLPLDAPGHGRSSHVRADLWQGAALLVEASGPATYLGYSMGGRHCLHVALAHPGAVRGLVLLSATAGIEDETERGARRVLDQERAERLERQGVDAFLEGWLAQPLFVGLSEETAGREARRESTAAGLAASLRLAGTGAQEPLWDRLGAIDAPVLVVAGARDAAYVELAGRLAASVGPNASVALVADAGHAAHLERPHGFVDVLRPWLAAHRL